MVANGAQAVRHHSWGNLNFSRTAPGITKWFWVTIEGYLSYFLPKFEDFVPTGLGSGALYIHARNYSLHPVHTEGALGLTQGFVISFSWEFRRLMGQWQGFFCRRHDCYGWMAALSVGRKEMFQLSEFLPLFGAAGRWENFPLVYLLSPNRSFG